jgi:thioredoxin-dependent peroxiredoxin
MAKLQAGDAAPAFSGVNEKGEPVSLSDFKGKKLILFFYPKANTPGCTAEACSLRDHYAELKEKGFAILGVSPDSEKSQLSFSEKFSFPYPLLADKDKVVANQYGVWGQKKFMGKDVTGILRTTFVIDENGVIEKIFDKVNTKEHAQQILEAY